VNSLLDDLVVDEAGTYGLLLAGRPTAGGGATLELRSRLDQSLLGRVATASAGDVTKAYDLAAPAQRRWAALPPAERGAVLQRAAQLFRDRAEDLGEVIAAEMGKPIGEARTEVQKGAAILEYFAQQGYRPLGATYVTDTGEDAFTIEEPLGVVALITPWNFPFTLPIRKIAAALATGNAALFKPAGNAYLTGLAIGRTLLEAGLPGEVLAVVVGESKVIQEPLFRDPRLGGVSLTGSYPTAVAIRELLPVEVPYQAELGGKNVLVVWHDADLDEAARIIWQSAFRNNGQICTSCGRLLVHEDVHDALLERLRRDVLAQPSSTADGDYGVLSSEWEHEKIVEVIDRNRAGVTEVIQPDWGPGRLGPTVLVAPTAAELIEEEIFGPVVTFEAVASIEEAIERGNRSAYGLTAGIVTNDLAVAGRFWQGIRAGLVKINAPLTGTPYHIPLQGHGHSGVGPGEGGDASTSFFTRRKAVYLRRPTTS